MLPLTLEAALPLSSTEISSIDPERIEDVSEKHRAVAEFLESRRYDALLLQKPENFAWFTSGGDATRRGSSESTAALFLTPDARVLVCSNTDTAQLFEYEVAGLGFQLKERPWHEPRQILLNDLCRGRKVAGDVCSRGIEDVSLELSAMRLPLTGIECGRMRQLGRAVSHAVEATARGLSKGRTESEIAGELAHRLIKHEMVPERLQVLADGRTERYRHWSYSDRRVEKFCVVTAIARRWGLCCGAARTVCFGTPSEAFQSACHSALLVQATGMYFSQPEWEFYEIWNRIRRIYEKFGFADEWRMGDQANVTGYQPAEIPLFPNSQFRLSAGVPVHWYPAVGAALAGDTILVTPQGFEVLTPMEDWPRVQIAVKGTLIDRPDLLRRG